MRVLLVEDDRSIGDDIAQALTQAGFRIDRAHDGEAAWFLGETEDFDLAILDLGLPRMDGLSVLKRWREAGRLFPVMILSARGSWPEKVDGIEAGADDYLAKPFQMPELIARARGLIRRSSGFAAPALAFGRLSIDTNRMSVALDNRPVALSPLEYRVVAYLVHQRGRAVPAGELSEHLHGDDGRSDTNAVEAMISRIRRKLGAEHIETRRGFGYRFCVPDETAS